MRDMTAAAAAMALFLLNGAGLAAAQTGPVSSCKDWFKGSPQKWVEPQDTAMAMNDPDCYAWRLFIAINWPADEANKTADANKQFGADGPAVWETWRNVRNRAPDTVFPRDGSDPGEWLGTTQRVARNIDDMDTEALQQLAARGGAPAELDAPAAEFSINETRMNKTSYEFVRSNVLYNLQGQVALFDRGVETIVFPLNAKEIKAQWRQIEEADKPRYHWANVTTSDGTVRPYGLTALHITTKDLPNWVWATFEHVDNKVPEADGGRKGNEGWLLQSVDRFSCAAPPHNCETPPTGIGLEGTKWANYVLRGTQIDFVDSRGNPTLLANSQPEENFQTSSSCITCHSMSTIGAAGDRLKFFKSLPPVSPAPVGHVGTPNPAWFRAPGLGSGNEGKLLFTQLDFVWSLFRARPASP
jgi:hypothetical protein